MDDEESYRKQTKIYLEKMNDDFEVDLASTVDQALKKIEEEDYNVVVSDYKMSPKDGLDFLEDIRLKGLNIPFIIFTGRGREEVAMKALNLGADRYIKKGGQPKSQYEFLNQAIIQEFRRYTDKKEKRLQKTYFHELFENSPEAIVLLDNKDRVIEANKAFEEIFKYKRDEVKGKYINNLIVPEDKKDEASSMSEMALSGNTFETETVRKRKDGESISVLLLGYPIELDGEQVGVFGIYRDITKRKETERALKENEKKYRTIFESANDAIFIMDKNKFIDCNEKALEMFDCDEEEILQKPPWKFSPERQPDDIISKEKAEEKIMKALEGEPQSFDWVHKRMDGSEFHAEINLSRYEIDDEVFVLAIVRDITERRRTKRDLKVANENIKKLHNIANEFDRCEVEEEIYELILKTSEKILDFYVCSVDLVEKGDFKVVATKGGKLGEGETYPFEGIAGKTMINNESYLIDDLEKEKEAIPKRDIYRSAISVPIGNLGVFQALSEEKNHFDEQDLELVEILLNHASEAINHLRFEKALQKRNERIKRLHETAIRLDECSTEDMVYEITVEAANKVLGFYDCTLAVFDEKDDEFIIKKTLRGEYEEGHRVPKDWGYMAKTYRNRSSYLIGDINEDELAEPEIKQYRSAISVPIGDIGVFQAISSEKDHYNHEDIEMAEILLSHTYQVIQKIRGEKAIEKSKDRWMSIFENTGTATIIIEKDGTITQANKNAEKLFGFYEGSPVGENFDEFLVEEEKDRLSRYHNTLLEEPESAPEKYDFQLLTRQEDIKDMRADINKIPGTDEIILSLIDISERKMMSKSKNRLKSMIRDIEDDLVRLETYIEILEEADLDESRREYISKIKKIIEKDKDSMNEI